MEGTTAPNKCPTCRLLPFVPEDDGKKRTPRMEELLRYNHAPLDVELAEFRAMVDDTPTIFLDLDEKVSRAQDVLDRLKHARAKAASHLADMKSLLHPIRSIPNEILGEIFSHGLHSWLNPVSEEDIDSLNPRLAPWVYTRVCRRWRDVSLALPHLRSYLALEFDARGDNMTPRQFTYRTGLFLARSGNTSLTVVFGSARDSEKVVEHPVIPLLEVTIPRWVAIDFSMPASSLQTFSGNIFSRLAVLDISDGVTNPENLQIDTFDTPLRAPALTALLCPSTSSILETIQVPWSQITKLERFQPNIDSDICVFFQRMTALTYLGVEINDTYHPLGGRILALPTVETLQITERLSAKSEDLAEFVTGLVLLSLSKLKLYFPRVEGRPLCLPTFRASPTKLTNLTIRCAMSRHSESTQNLLAFLSVTTHVEHLVLNAPGYDTGQPISSLD